MAGHTEPHTLYTDGASAVPGDALEPGSVIAGYRIDGVLGRGGMGVVYAATDAELGRRVALKVVPAGGSDARQHQQFLREAMSAATVEHPHILPVYRSGEDGGMLYIAMRLVDGESLQQLVQTTGPLPAHRAARIVAQVGQALDAAHARGLVHRDVKPANILIADPGEDEHAYLADFGIAAASGSSRRWSGTFAYTAPEQLTEGTVDARGDVYALGCVLYFCLTGRPPFDADNEVAAVAARQSQPVSLAGTAPDHIPAELDTVVARALSTDPSERFASAGALGQAALAARFDVAVCSHADDRAVATALCEQLTERGMTTITVDVVSPSAALHAAGGCVVVVGRSGLAGWARSAVVAARDLAARDRSYRLVTAIVPGGPSPFDPRLAFLGAYPWADLRDGVDAGTDRVVRALSGHATQRLGEATDLECPYPGLEAFDEEQASDFFGREREIEQVVEQLEASRFIAIVGASGSGKSSLVRAGVVPRLRRDADDRTTVITVVPGASPIAALSAALAATLGLSQADVAAALDDEGGLDRLVGATDPPLRLVVVVDQFEEVFTLCPDPAERERFMSTLAYAATVPDGAVSVIIACRADFVHRLAEHDGLRQLAAAHQLSLGTMSAANLRDAIERPARRMGVDLEPGLTRRILTDLPREAGSLPLLGHLLRELWERRSADTLTLAAYDAAGGVGGALARHADSVMADMTDDQREIARRLLLRLTQPGDGTEDTRRRATKSELLSIGDPETVEPVLARLTAGRLVSTGVDEHGDVTVDVAHEALIRNWPTLRSWIDESRDQLRLHRRLTDASRDWEAAQRDDGMLFRGASLAAWRDRDQSELNATEAAFLDASIRAADHAAETRRKRVLAGFVALGGVAVVLSAATIFGFTQRSTAASQRDLAESRQLAASARLQLDSDPELSVLLATEAMRADDSPEADETLRLAVARSSVRASHRAHGGPVRTVGQLPDGRVVSGGQDGSIVMWTLGTEPVRIASHDGGLEALAASSEATFASAGSEGLIRLWDGTGTELAVGKGHAGPVYDVAFASTGKALASAGDDGTVRLWPGDLTSSTVLRGHEGAVAAIAWSPDGTRLASAGRDDFTIRIWDRRTGRNTTLMAATRAAYDVAFSPDGKRLVAALGDNTARIITIADPTRAIRLSASSLQGVQGARFSPSGSHVVTIGGDGQVLVWRVDGTLVSTLHGHNGPGTAAIFDRTGSQVITTGRDGSVRVWDWTNAQPTAEFVSPVDFPIEGGTISVPGGSSILSAGLDASLRRWNPTDGRSTQLLPGGPTDSYVNTAAVNPTDNSLIVSRPDGTLEAQRPGGGMRRLAGEGIAVWTLALRADGRAVVSGRDDGSVRIWDLHSSRAEAIPGHTGPVNAVTFAPDGQVIASAGEDGLVILRRADTNEVLQTLRGHDGAVLSVAFSPDGQLVVTGGRDRTVRIWSRTGGAPLVLRGHAGSVTSVAFGSDPSRVISVSDDQLRVWDPGRQNSVFQIDSPEHNLYRAELNTDDSMVILQTLNAHIQIFDCSTCGDGAAVQTLATQHATRALTDEERLTFHVE